MRGNRAAIKIAIDGVGSIPACAGEPNAESASQTCGGHHLEAGLSPRVRGNRCRAEQCDRNPGSIPACAGEPSGRAFNPSACLSPRVRGNPSSQRARPHEQGLSPRVRGNHAVSEAFGKAIGSIPACAGEPECKPSPLQQSWVYPRVCGGTIPGLDLDGAGGVYPRVCGGTSRPPSPIRVLTGLSPRVRGNPKTNNRTRYAYGSIPACAGEPERQALGLQGSIPACAGEPCRERIATLIVAVYPRVCGGTRLILSVLRPIWGLSPRVRGNLSQNLTAADDTGSIPACAGEPRGSAVVRHVPRVYPRVCGGTAARTSLRPMTPGLSPRVRGNHGDRAVVRHVPRVYPRVCGGTAAGRDPAGQDVGLSPRVRGNLLGIDSQIPRLGSIPACAGEPRPQVTRTVHRGVYPRVCGGTLGAAK